MVAAAMNEQGFLFSQKVQETLQFPGPGRVSRLPWQFEAREYPVTAFDGEQTRIDLVFRSTEEMGLYACIECKSANPLYKRWIFFDNDTSQTLFFEVIQIGSRTPTTSANHIRSDW
jgi:hypothetical protein